MTTDDHSLYASLGTDRDKIIALSAVVFFLLACVLLMSFTIGSLTNRIDELESVQDDLDTRVREIATDMEKHIKYHN